MSQQKSISQAKIRGELDLSLEGVILLVFGLFASLFGWLLLGIHTGALPYSPDSMYGLFLVLVSIQAITLGKTPFGDLRRSWLVIFIGTGAAVIGMTACFIPGSLTGGVRILVGSLLALGGATLLFQLFVAEEKAKTWMKVPGILRRLTLVAALVYGLSVIAGLMTLFPGLTTHPQTAVLLILYGISFFYLAWSIQEVRRRYPPEIPNQSVAVTLDRDNACPKPGFSWFREASLPLSLAVLFVMAVLLTLLGLLLFPVTLGILPFSPDGQLGLLLVLMAIQMMALGNTPLGPVKRSWLIILVGIGFAALGIFSCIVPGMLTGRIQILLGLLNIIEGVVLLVRRFLPMRPARKPPEAGGDVIPPLFKNLMLTQTVLNLVSIAFGLSMFLPGLVPGPVIAGILVINGVLLFLLVLILHQLDEAAQDTSRRDTQSSEATSM